MRPVLRAILHEYLLLRVGAGWPRASLSVLGAGLWHRPNKARVHVVGEGPADLALDLGEAMLRQSFLRVL